MIPTYCICVAWILPWLLTRGVSLRAEFGDVDFWDPVFAFLALAGVLFFAFATLMTLAYLARPIPVLTLDVNGLATPISKLEWSWVRVFWGKPSAAAPEDSPDPFGLGPRIGK
jgi:hypothetical protein